ncbi:MAG TPA: AAA domain-containing protein [Phycisphaerae bacterium]|nr:AAA domain-containing protein [Phycisphaerae bacterium]
MQVEAVRKSLASNATFVWGPPGTGKTTTLARIVEGHYFAGKSVLLVSSSNIAVDTALEKIADRLKSDEGFQSGSVIRFGPDVKEELAQKYGDQVVLEKVVARLSKSSQQELAVVQSEAATVARDADHLRTAIAQHQEVATFAETLSREKRSCERLRGKIQEYASSRQSQEQSLTQLKHNIERAGTMGGVRRFFSGLNPERIRRQISQTDAQLKASADAKKAVESEFADPSVRTRSRTPHRFNSHLRLIKRFDPAEVE